jgi:fluoride ion exporter CrcB/FEX
MGPAFNRRKRLMAPTNEKEPLQAHSACCCAGGALGALTRHLVDRSIEGHASGVFPWSTFTIDLSGCFVVGVVVAALVDRHHTPEWCASA